MSNAVMTATRIAAGISVNIAPDGMTQVGNKTVSILPASAHSTEMVIERSRRYSAGAKNASTKHMKHRITAILDPKMLTGIVRSSGKPGVRWAVAYQNSLVNPSP